MSVKNRLRSWFTFGRKDRLGLLALSLLILLVYALPRYFRRPPEPPRPLEPAVTAAIDSFQKREAARTISPRESGSRPADRPAERFPFDPNTLDEAGWVRLGLRPKTAASILKYRSKGGRFRKPEDLQKVWGLPPGFYEAVKDLIQLESPVGTERPAFADRPAPVPAYERKHPDPVAINSADTAAWIALPGIGSKLAARIVAFREKLGGFSSVEQVAETFGLRDSTFQLIRPYLRLDGSVRSINLNSASLEELKEHPYIRWNGARAIVAYRQQHGKFGSAEELRKINLFDEATVARLMPYLRVD